MKCKNCGYIFNGDFDACPYCGTIQKEKSESVLHRNIKIGEHNILTVRGILNTILINAFLIAFCVDWIFFTFSSSITLLAFAICFGLMTIISILYNYNSLISAVERINAFLLAVIIICSLLPSIFGQDLRSLFAFFVLPIYLIVISIVFAILLIKRRGAKFRPIVADLLFTFHFLLSLTTLIFLLIHYNNSSIDSWFMIPNLELAQPIIIFAGFVISSLLIMNYNLVLFFNAIKKAKYIYGK